ncbi:hypothetical protein [Victivallis sp. Marseille-Q1083]|uniref:hypothetical protein n=1 Tax=Victivallis sp. Marseille-Q1083 TaxID=2717288 RepID=UPI00158D2F57|nr:hypothetical protein [Victivallis sp. Marseille-Q1083]
MNDDTEKLKAKGDSPKSAEIDNQKIEQHTLKDQIALDRYISAKQATRRGLGVKISKMHAGGAQ